MLPRQAGQVAVGRGGGDHGDQGAAADQAVVEFDGGRRLRRQRRPARSSPGRSRRSSGEGSSRESGSAAETSAGDSAAAQYRAAASRASALAAALAQLDDPLVLLRQNGILPGPPAFPAATAAWYSPITAAWAASACSSRRAQVGLRGLPRAGDLCLRAARRCRPARPACPAPRARPATRRPSRPAAAAARRPPRRPSSSSSSSSSSYRSGCWPAPSACSRGPATPPPPPRSRPPARRSSQPAARRPGRRTGTRSRTPGNRRPPRRLPFRARGGQQPQHLHEQPPDLAAVPAQELGDRLVAGHRPAEITRQPRSSTHACLIFREDRIPLK